MPLSREEMRAYQRERRRKADVNQPVNPPVLQPDPVNQAPEPTVLQPTTVKRSPTVNQPMNPTRAFLRAELDRLRDAYGVCQRAMDWPGCRAVNEEREPLFHQLWVIERELPETGRYWFPARVLNAGLDHSRKAHA